MKSLLFLFCTVSLALAQAPFNATNIRLSAPPVQATTGNIARLLTLNPSGVGETITPTKTWDAIVATGTVDTTDISGFSALGRSLVDDLLQDDMLNTLGATTVGKAFFNTANPSAITFVRVNANNSISFQTAANYRTDIGGTTVGQGYFTLPNPGAITFPRQNANDTVTSRTAVELKTDLSLENVTNTSDANKPVSTAQQTALDLKANLAGGAPFTGTVTIGTGGTAIVQVLSVTAVVDFTATNPNETNSAAVTVTGAALGDVVSLGVPHASVPGDGSYFAWVSAVDTVTIRFVNQSAVNTPDPASGTFRIMVTKF